jgi:hypothetical protein
MIAKIDRGKNLMGALYYNYHKVEKEKAQVLFTHKIIESPDGSHSVAQLSRSFELYLVANRKTEKPILHISLNPDPKDTVSDADFMNIAQDYMKEMGYSNQPFVVFKHNDIERTHIHIVSICVDAEGRKIADTFEKRRSMMVCRALEKEYNLISAMEKKQNSQQLSFKPVDYKLGDVKSQMASVIRHLPNQYAFQSIGAYNALLSLFNITTEEVRGQYNGITKQGLLYFALNDKGEKVSNPFKASLFGKSAGHSQLLSYCENSKIRLQNHPVRASLKASIERTFQTSTNEIDFKKGLQLQGIDTVTLRNKEGRLYGITFIDHASKTLWNGSQLGKSLSANVVNASWQKDTKREYVIDENQPQAKHDQSEEIDGGQTHDLNFFEKEIVRSAPREKGLLESLGALLPQDQGEDYEEQAFANRMKKKTRKRKR